MFDSFWGYYCLAADLFSAGVFSAGVVLVRRGEIPSFADFAWIDSWPDGFHRLEKY